MRGRNGTFHRYCHCQNHDPLRAGGEHRRCPERNIRADELDSFVFEQVRNALLRPETLLDGERAVSERREPVDDELLHRSKEVRQRMQELEQQCDALVAQRKEFARQNALSKRITGFSESVAAGIDRLDFAERQKLLRLVVERVRVKGWRVDISLRIPLNEDPESPDPELSSIDRLRSVDTDN